MPSLPAQWHNESGQLSVEITRDGWRAFGSGELNRLVAQAEEESLDVAAAVTQVRQAETVARIAGAPLLPEMTASLDAGRQGSFSDGDSARNYGTAFSAQFELDFWGGNHAYRDAALATLAASEFDRDTVRLTVTAGVAHTWFEIVALRERIGLAELNLKSAERLLELVESRLRAGAASPLKLAQQRGLTAGQRRTVVLLRQQANAARTVLETLLASPGGIEIGEEEMLDSLSVLVLGAGIPSVWLTRRPDIARAEALLVAADADLLAARAALLPSLTLETEISATAGSLRRVFDHPAYSLVSGLTAPIFDAGRLAAARDLSAAEREERLANYRRTILDAFSDVELALNEAWSLETQARLQTEELAQAQRALKLAEARYRAGAETLLTLLDAQRVFYAARDEALQLQLARLHAAVFLYKVGGGGWRGNRNEESKRDGSRHSPRRASIMNEVLLAGRLRRAKLRATFSRLKVLEMLAENPGSQRVDNIIRQLSERKLPVNIGSAYRALREMHAAGLVLCLRDAQHARRYCLKPESAAPALRLVCRDSGERLVFSNPEFHAHILAVAAQQELKLEGREFDLQARTEHRERTIRRFTGARPPDDNDPRKVWITLGKKPVHPMKTVPWAPA